jgi:hypothetical protein
MPEARPPPQLFRGCATRPNADTRTVTGTNVKGTTRLPADQITDPVARTAFRYRVYPAAGVPVTLSTTGRCALFPDETHRLDSAASRANLPGARSSGRSVDRMRLTHQLPNAAYRYPHMIIARVLRRRPGAGQLEHGCPASPGLTDLRFGGGAPHFLNQLGRLSAVG